MQEIRIDKEDLTRLVGKLKAAPEKFKEARRQAFEAAQPEAKRIVDFSIDAAIHDDRGRVKSWQEAHVGSGGGYVAVRPKAETYIETENGNRYAVGRITNAIVSGHRTPSGGRVEAFPFYDRAQSAMKNLARRTADKVVKTLTDYLED